MEEVWKYFQRNNPERISEKLSEKNPYEIPKRHPKEGAKKPTRNLWRILKKHSAVVPVDLKEIGNGKILERNHEKNSERISGWFSGGIFHADTSGEIHR